MDDLKTSSVAYSKVKRSECVRIPRSRLPRTEGSGWSVDGVLKGPWIFISYPEIRTTFVGSTEKGQIPLERERVRRDFGKRKGENQLL